MNEEEKQAIELLKIDCLVTSQQINDGELFMIEDEEKMRISATQVLLNLIDKQQKEIEELKDDLKEERALNVEALKTLKECVHKDKIKEKIEEVEKKKEKTEILDFKAFYSIKEIKNIEINILKELLGE